MKVPVGISNRHIHLSDKELAILFGDGYELNPLKPLSQPGQYAYYTAIIQNLVWTEEYQRSSWGINGESKKRRIGRFY